MKRERERVCVKKNLEELAMVKTVWIIYRSLETIAISLSCSVVEFTIPLRKNENRFKEDRNSAIV